MKHLQKFSIFFVVLLVISCENEQRNNLENQTPETKLFSRVSSFDSNIKFRNQIFEDESNNPFGYDYYYNGAGVATGDLDNDGLPEIFLAGNTSPNKLYKNLGNLKFKDVSSTAGFTRVRKWATGVNFIDINQDGLLDIYVSYAGPRYLKNRKNELYINNGNLSFSEKAKEYGIDDGGFSTHSAFFDFDNDNDYDLVVLNHTSFNEARVSDYFQALDGLPNEKRKEHMTRFYENKNGEFTDVTDDLNLNLPSYGLGIIANDFNQDGFVDIYVANDYFIPDYFLINKAGKGFENKIKDSFKHTPYYSMGVDAADINNDGMLDLAVVDMTPADHVRSKANMPSMNPKLFETLKTRYNYTPQFMFNSLQLAVDNCKYSDIALMSGVAKTEWSWAPLFADFDLDGDKDFFITNGFRRDTRNNDWLNKVEKIGITSYSPETLKKYYQLLLETKMTPTTNYFYKNIGPLEWENASEKSGIIEESFSNGMAYSDLDNDGDLDIIINNIDNEAFLYKNNSSEAGKRSVAFSLKNAKNCDVLNAHFTLETTKGKQYIQSTNVRGYMSSMEPIARFGLQKDDQIIKVLIEFRGQILEVPVHKISFDSINTFYLNDLKPKEKYFSDESSTMFFIDETSISHIHAENSFNDFEKEILLPHKQSTLGPMSCTGDINGDGLDDVFIGGAKGQSPKLYRQNTDGKFDLHFEFVQDKDYEDMGCVFLDIESDGDLDLYIASGGGGEFENNKDLLEDRFYINLGDGTFKKSNTYLTKNQISAGRILKDDWDDDGDEDLLVLGRTNPGKYPLPTKSIFLRNDNSNFTDITDQINDDFNNLGMITDAIWMDYNQDKRKELFIVGEWTDILVYEWNDGKLKQLNNKVNLDNTSGWWYSINHGDFNNDGREDILVGNVGENCKFKATKDSPFYLYSNDFDSNGTYDIVLSNKYKNNYVPTRGRQCSSDQMPFIKEKFDTYQSFADATLVEIYGQDKLNNSIQLNASSFKSSVFLNKPNGFERIDLPREAQISPINGSIIKDFNQDNILDVIIAGNAFNTEVETPSYDSGYGHLLLGNGNGTFKPVPATESGILLGGNVKDLQAINLSSKKKEAFIVTNNNSKTQLLVPRN